MAPSQVGMFFVLIQQSLFVHTTDIVTCFGVNGLGYPDNVICPGSDACCGVNATCMDNRLCHTQGQNNETFIRGPCSIFPYNTQSCAEICIYSETAVDGGFLPRVTVCADGSFCCDNKPDCCENGQGVFLSDTGQIVSSLPSSSSSSTTISSSSSSASPSSSSVSATKSAITTSASKATSPGALHTSAVSTPSPSLSSGGLSTGAKVGIGVGVPLGIIAFAGLAAIIFLRRRTRGAEQTLPERSEGVALTETNYAQPKWRYAGELDCNQSPHTWGTVEEMDSTPSPHISELPGSN